MNNVQRVPTGYLTPVRPYSPPARSHTMNDQTSQRVRTIRETAEAELADENTRSEDAFRAEETVWLVDQLYGLDETVHDLREQLVEDHAITRDRLAKAWQEGFKQGGPMHDVNYDDPDAHTRNPYREAEARP